VLLKIFFVASESRNAPEFLHPGQSARLEFEGKPVGFIGTLHPNLADELKIREPVAMAEFNLDKLLSGQPKFPQYKAISKMPAVDRDIAFLMPKDLSAATVEIEIRKTAGELLRDLRVFDVFEGESLPEGQRSVAFRLIFQTQDSTLEDQKVNELRDKVVSAVSQKFGITLRQ
jgi:phenylalanyl-tRNA synthetase beta chain